MLNQYHRPRHRLAPVHGRLCTIGTIPVGTIFRIPLRFTAEGRFRMRKLIIEGWLPRRISGWRRTDVGPAIKVHDDGFVARGGHLAVVRFLDDGRRTWMGDHLIQTAIDRHGDA